MMKMFKGMTKSIALMGFGLTFAVGCGGSPEESAQERTLSTDIPAVSSQACPVTGCGGDEPPSDSGIYVSLKCELDVWNSGVRITNTSSRNVPSGALIRFKLSTYTTPIYGTTSGPLAIGQSKVAWARTDNAIACTASAEW
jgi:hypothetical protein